MSTCANKSNSLNGSAKFPAWIRPEVFLDLLKQIYDKFEEITDFSVDNALAPGENYAAIMLKVDINMKLRDSSSQRASFMLKVAHDNEVFDNIAKCHDLFAAESGMFHNIVPGFEKLYANAGIYVKFCAKAYQLPTNEKYMLLKNLKTQGFTNKNRLDGLDEKHTECVLKKLAQWHAASAVRVAADGPFPSQYCKAFFKPACYDIVKSLFNGKTLLECVKEYKNSVLYYDKVTKLQDKITDELFKFVEPDLSEFNVLNHGDCWSNNIMFKYDEQGNIIETYFVDLQVPRYSSPAQDIFYFLLSSTQLEIRLKKFDYFIKFYHDHLIEVLKLLNYNRTAPSLKEIHLMILKYGIYGYMTVTNIMAAVLCDPTDIATVENFVTDSEDGVNFRKQMYSNLRYRSHMEEILPWLLYKGLLDC